MLCLLAFGNLLDGTLMLRLGLPFHREIPQQLIDKIDQIPANDLQLARLRGSWNLYERTGNPHIEHRLNGPSKSRNVPMMCKTNKIAPPGHASPVR
jgi:hypothetical protein